MCACELLRMKLFYNQANWILQHDKGLRFTKKAFRELDENTQVYLQTTYTKLTQKIHCSHSITPLNFVAK